MLPYRVRESGVKECVSCGSVDFSCSHSFVALSRFVCRSCGVAGVMCPHCDSISEEVDSGSMKEMSHCRECDKTNRVPHAIAEVANQHYGELVCDIIDKRSEKIV